MSPISKPQLLLYLQLSQIESVYQVAQNPWTISLGRRLRVTLLLCLSAHPTTSAAQHSLSWSCAICACRRACARLGVVVTRALFASVVFKVAILSTGFEEAPRGSQRPVPVASRSAHAT